MPKSKTVFHTIKGALRLHRALKALRQLAPSLAADMEYKHRKTLITALKLTHRELSEIIENLEAAQNRSTQP